MCAPPIFESFLRLCSGSRPSHKFGIAGANYHSGLNEWGLEMEAGAPLALPDLIKCGLLHLMFEHPESTGPPDHMRARGLVLTKI